MVSVSGAPFIPYNLQFLQKIQSCKYAWPQLDDFVSVQASGNHEMRFEDWMVLSDEKGEIKPYLQPFQRV